MRLVWLTDIHLNFLKRSGSFKFGRFIRNNSSPDVVVISGDISESPALRSDLIEFQRGLNKPICFVLGNHDYYDGSFEKTNFVARGLIHNDICWLTEFSPMQIGTNTFIVGHEGWYDAKCGIIDEYHGKMTDFTVIEDFVKLSFNDLIIKFRELGENSAKQAEILLLNAVANKACKNIIFITHFPPFVESSYYRNEKTESNYLPYYVNLSMGIMLMNFAKNYPDIDITVLCGHTHVVAFWQPLMNLRVYTGSAEYGRPQVNKVFEIE